MNLRKLTQTIDRIFPVNVAVEGDRVGLQIDSGIIEVNKILVAFEINDNVLAEADNLNVDLIVGFHPLIFNSLRSIDSSERVGNICTRLIKSSIAYYCIHTSLDTDPKGSNFYIAKKLNLKNITPLEKDKENSLGVIGEFESPIAVDSLVKNISDIFETNIKQSANGPDYVNKVAIVAGSGMSMIDKVESDNSIDAFITADTKYHDFHRVDGRINLIDPGHYEMERFNAEIIHKRLVENLKDNVEVHLSKINTNPIKYYMWN